MPKLPIDYSKSVIYRIYCDDPEVKECYIGSTTNLTKRRCEHIHDCRDPSKKAYNRKLYQFIRNNGSFLKWNVVLEEDFPCENNEQLRRRETYWVKHYNATLNSRMPVANI